MVHQRPKPSVTSLEATIVQIVEATFPGPRFEIVLTTSFPRIALLHLSRMLRGSANIRQRPFGFASTVDLKFMEFPVIRSGGPERAPLFILPGLLGSAVNWRSIAVRPEVSLDRRVFSLDMRNHGGSPHHESMTLDDMASDVIALADRLHLPKVALLGHSMGGKVV